MNQQQREKTYRQGQRTFLDAAKALEEGRCTLNEALTWAANITPVELQPGDKWPDGQIVHDYTTWPPKGL